MGPQFAVSSDRLVKPLVYKASGLSTAPEVPGQLLLFTLTRHLDMTIAVEGRVKLGLADNASVHFPNASAQISR